MRKEPADRATDPSFVVRSHLQDFEQPSCAHAAADAHRHDDVLGTAPLAFEQRVDGAARAGHPDRKSVV